MTVRWGVTFFALSSCVETRSPASDTWFDLGDTLGVVEPIAFTDVPYDFTGATSLSDTPRAPEFSTLFAEGESVPACDAWSETPDLPVEVEGIVTVLPRVYLKTDGCIPVGDPDAQSDEKNYGSFFIEDASGGFFVLGDDKLADFGAGDRLVLRVGAVKERFDLDAVASYEVISVVREAAPIFYRVRTTALDAASIALVQRMTGTVTIPPDTFGETTLVTDEGVEFVVQLDAELTRRGLTFDVGDVVMATGPVLYSYSTYALVVMQLGQIELLQEAL